jgi:SAM-dependent methyltransferase
MDEVDTTLATYEAIAPEYAARWATNDAVVQTALARFAAHLAPGALVADVGCGPGRDLVALAARGFVVVGIDLSQAMLREARLRSPAPLVAADMRSLPLRPGRLDGLWACASLLHVPKRQAPSTVRALRDCMRPGGVAFFALKEGAGEGLVTKHGRARFYALYAADELDGLLSRAGFQIVDAWTDRGTAPDPWLNRVVRRR